MHKLQVLNPKKNFNYLGSETGWQHTSYTATMEASRGPPRVKNKAPAPQQISAEQLLREAVDRQEPGLQAPTQRFADLEELHEFQGRKRKEFEDYVRRNRINMNNWLRYAQWELEQKEFRRARSIFERALDVDATSVVLWIRYTVSSLLRICFSICKDTNPNECLGSGDENKEYQPCKESIGPG